MYWRHNLSNEFLKKVQRALIFKHSPEQQHASKTFLQPHAVCTPPNSRCTRAYSTIFARLQCLHSRSCIRAEHHSCCLFQATAPTQSHPHFVILTQQHWRSSTRNTLCERIRKTHEMEHGEGQHWDSRQLPGLMQHCVHAEGCSSTRCLDTTFCAALSSGQGLFNAVSAFSPFVPNFSIVPSRQEKKLVCPEKNGTEPWQNLVAGAGPLGWSRQGGQLRDCGPGRDGGRSRAAREILDFFLNAQDFFRGKNLAILRGKSGTTTCSYVLLRRSYHFNYAAFMYGLFLNITISKDCRPMAWSGSSEQGKKITISVINSLRCGCLINQSRLTHSVKAYDCQSWWLRLAKDKPFVFSFFWASESTQIFSKISLNPFGDALSSSEFPAPSTALASLIAWATTSCSFLAPIAAHIS